MMIQHCLLVFCSCLGLMIAPPSPAVGQAGNPSLLLTELSELIAARKQAISSVHITADRLSLAGSRIIPSTPDQVKEILLQYGATAGRAEDREVLFRSLHRPEDPSAPLATSVEFYRDGVRTAQRSGVEQFVTDERATVWAMSAAGGGRARVQVNIWEPHRANRGGSLGIHSFSSELGIRVPEAAFKGIQSAIVDDTGHIILKWDDGSSEFVYEIAREDGIMRSSRSTSKNFVTLYVQAGRYRTRDGIPFPAVSGRFSYQSGKLDSIQLVAPKSIEVNEPIPAEVFRIAAVAGSIIVDERDQPSKGQRIAHDVDDVVVYASDNRVPRKETAPVKDEKP